MLFNETSKPFDSHEHTACPAKIDNIHNMIREAEAAKFISVDLNQSRFVRYKAALGDKAALVHKKSRSARRQPELFPFPNILLTHSPVRPTPETTISSICYSKAPTKSTKILLKHLTMTVPTSCCGRSGQSCVCASKAKCSCGKQSALHCNCEKAKTENAVAGARCSCRKPTSHYQA